MPAERTCSQCGAPLPANAPGNRCPKCLLALALEDSASERGSPEPQQTGITTPEKTTALPESDVVIEQPGMMIGRYKLLQQIGEGGFGVVFMAEQTEPVQRKVALKVIKAGMDTREIIARFEAERQALALMDHPNIAKILDAGVTGSPLTRPADTLSPTGGEGRGEGDAGHPRPSDSPSPVGRERVAEGRVREHGEWRGAGGEGLSAGRPYFVMELVRGLPITDYCDHANLSTRERLELFIKVCRAVQHAHQKGVIHRDLKPTNVLVTLHDGEPVPKVIDFGVAKALGQKLTNKTLFTRFEQMIGTPAYMSPEQAALSGLDVDTRSDIYSLGVLLYELLTGVTPLDAETLREAALDEVRRMIQETEPPRPSTRVATLGERLADVARCRHAEPASLPRLIRGDLDWITMKALEKDRQRRYETVNGLAADVERHLRDEPVVARPPSALYRLQKVARRHRVAFAAGAAVAVALVLGVIISTWQAVRATRAEREQIRLRQQAQNAQASEAIQRQRAERNANESWQNAAESRERLVRQYVASGNRLVDDGDLFGALPWFAKALKEDQNDPARAEIHRLRLGATLGQCPKLVHAWFHKGTVKDAKFSPDGQWVVTASADRTARVWNAATGDAISPLLEGAGEQLFAAFSPDGQRLAVANPTTGSGGVWDPKTGKPFFFFPAPQHHTEFSLDGKLVLTASSTTAQLYDAFTGAKIGQTMNNETYVTWVCFSRDGTRVLTVSAMVAIWRIPTGEQIVRLRMAENRSANHGEFSPDGRWVAIGCGDGTAWVFDAATGKEITLVRHQGRVHRTRFSPDGRWLLTSSDDGTAGVWNAATGLPVGATMRHAGPIVDAGFSPDGRLVATASADGTAGVWHAATGRPVTARLKHAAPVVRASFSPDGQRVITASDDHTARLWDLSGAGKPFFTGKHPAIVLRAAFSPDSRWAVTVSVDGTAHVWDLVTGEPLGVMQPILAGIRHAQFSPDSRLLATASTTGTARVWELATGRPVSPPLIHTGMVNDVEFSRDGKMIVTAGSDRFARVWEVPSGRLVSEMRHRESVNFAWFTANGTELVTAVISVPDFFSIERWAFRLAEREATTLSAAQEFHPEPKWAYGFTDKAAISANSAEVRVWKVSTGQPVTGPAELGTSVSQVAVSPDGRRVLPTCSALALSENQIWLIDVETGKRLSGPLQHDKGIVCSALSPNGQMAATASWDGSARVWDAATGRPIGPKLQQGKTVFHVSFSPDSRLVATASEDLTARVWDAIAGEPLTPPLRHPAAVHRVFFTPDGRWLLTASINGFVHLWALPTSAMSIDDELVRAELLAGYHLDDAGATVPLSPQAIQSGWFKRQAQWADESRKTLASAQARQPSLAAADGEYREPPADTHPAPSPGGDFIVRAMSILYKVWGKPSSSWSSNDCVELVEAFSKAIETEPDALYNTMYFWRGRGYEQLGQYQKAIEDCRESLWRGWKKADLGMDYLTRGQCYLRLGEMETAEADFRRVIECSPGDAVGYNNLAWYYVTGPTNLRSPEKALALALKAVELGKTNHNELNTLGVVYYRLGQLTNAITTLETGIKADKEGGSAHDFFFLAMSYQRLGDSAKAHEYFARATNWVAAQTNLPPNHKAELDAFRAEADEILGKPKTK